MPFNIRRWPRLNMNGNTYNPPDKRDWMKFVESTLCEVSSNVCEHHTYEIGNNRLSNGTDVFVDVYIRIQKVSTQINSLMEVNSRRCT